MEPQNELLTEIEGAIHRLKVDFDRFFAGALPIPPEDQRTALARSLRRARSTPMKAFADRFRLNGLEARFNSLNELFNRRLREHETGRPARAAEAGKKPGYDVNEGVVLGRGDSLEAVAALYNELYRTNGRNAKTDFDSFHGYVRRQVDELRQQTGCDKIRFRVTTANGSPTLKVKPIK